MNYFSKLSLACTPFIDLKPEEYIKLVKRCREISYAYDIENMSKKFINILKSYVER
jgi:hypothetical protein